MASVSGTLSNDPDSSPPVSLLTIKVLNVRFKGSFRAYGVVCQLDVANQTYASEGVKLEPNGRKEHVAAFDDVFVFDVSSDVTIKFTLVSQPRPTRSNSASRLFNSVAMPKIPASIDVHKFNTLPSRIPAASRWFESLGRRTNPGSQTLGELFIYMPNQRRPKEIRTYIIPPTYLPSKSSEIEVTLEMGVLSNKLPQKSVRSRGQGEGRRGRLTEDIFEKQKAEPTQPEYSDFLNVFMRSGQISTWKRFWVVLDRSRNRLTLYDFEYRQEKSIVGTIPLRHMQWAAKPNTDMLSLGPTGIELAFSPLAMSDKHRRQSAFPHPSELEQQNIRLTVQEKEEYYRSWHCRVYFLADDQDKMTSWIDVLNAEVMRIRTSIANAKSAFQFNPTVKLADDDEDDDVPLAELKDGKTTVNRKYLFVWSSL